MDEALARNADLEAALARVREAQAALDGAARRAVADAGRQAAANARMQRIRHRDLLQPPRSRSKPRTTLDLWGRLSSATAAARHQLLATEWARASIEWGLTASVAETYFELGAVDRQIAVSAGGAHEPRQHRRAAPARIRAPAPAASSSCAAPKPSWPPPRRRSPASRRSRAALRERADAAPRPHAAADAAACASGRARRGAAR